MNLVNIILFLFILGAIGIGVSLSNNADMSIIDTSINNASIAIENINLTRTNNVSLGSIELEGMYIVIEKYIHFIGAFTLEIFRMGIKFGFNNPGYFEPAFIFQTIKFILILFLVSLLIKPVMYLFILIFMFGLWIKDKIKGKKEVEWQKKKV
jgi:hypothetical protein